MSLNIGDRLLNYEILALLGKGGFGTVYLARDVNLDINVALKVTHAEFSASDTMVYRLRVGARTAARLRHPNIQAVYYLGRDLASSVDFVVMEYLPGGTLRQRIALHRLPLREALAAFTTVCGAVDYAYQHGVIHRDLKPENIMYDAEGRLVVTDFDLARITGEVRHTRAGQTLGTLYYASPEQLCGDDVEHTSDVYSLGVMLFELMTGRWPFMGESELDILNGHLNMPPPKPSAFNPQVPPNVDAAVLRALAKAPAERFQSAWELACAASGQTYTPAQTRPAFESDSDILTPARLPTQATKPPAAASLRVLNGPQAGQCVALGAAGLSIGYGKAKNNLHLPDQYVSRAHARIDRQAETYQLMDLKSANGTKVNGKKIEPYTLVSLAPGDHIEVGDTLLVFELGDAA